MGRSGQGVLVLSAGVILRLDLREVASSLVAAEWLKQTAHAFFAGPA